MLNGFINTIDTLDIESISIKAFCDDTGTDWYNDVLSYKRAYTLYHYFPENKRVAFKGYGEISLSETPGNIAKERKRNRRAEIEVNFKVADTTTAKPAVTPENLVQKDSIEVPVVESVGVSKPDYKPLSSSLKPGDRVLLSNLVFKGGRCTLEKSSRKELKKILAFFKENPNMKFEIHGHVCCIEWFYEDAVDEDTGISNLSVSRARTIFEYLAKNGVDPKRMKYHGFGRDFPIEGGPEEENKRVEILITAN